MKIQKNNVTKHSLCHLWMRSILHITLSVVLCFMLCKPASAKIALSEGAFWQGFDLGGYSSAGVHVPNHGKTDASLNEISLILRWQGESRLSFFGELELEEPLSWNQSDQFIHDEGYFDLERFYFDYNMSESINVRAGRFLNPSSRWNLLHAPPLVWTTTRPLATSRLFPISANGFMLFGAVPFQEQGLEYHIFVEALKDQHRDDDENLFDNVMGIRLQRTGISTIGVSLSSFSETINQTTNYKMLGIDFLTYFKGWEISGEGFQRFANSGHNGGSGGYLQSVIPLGKRWFGITRVETFNHPQEGSSDRFVVGATWRYKPLQLFKIELVTGDEVRADSPKGLLASFAIFF